MTKVQSVIVKSFSSMLILSCLVLIYSCSHLTAQTLLTTVPLGPESGNGVIPISIGVNTATNIIYVLNRQSDNVSVIDGETNKVIDTISVGGTKTIPRVIGVNSITNRVYVIVDTQGLKGNSFVTIDGERNKVISARDVGGPNALPIGIGVNSATNLIYVLVHIHIRNLFEVVVIDGNTDKVIETINVGRSDQSVILKDIVVNPATNRIYVSSVESDDEILRVIDGETNEIIDTIILGDAKTDTVESFVDPGMMCVNSTTNHIYIALDNRVLPPGGGSFKSEFTLAVINGENNDVVVILPHEELEGRIGVTINPVTNRVYLSGTVPGPAGRVIVIGGETNKIIERIELENPSFAAEVNPLTNLIYSAGDSVDVIDGDSKEVINSITINASPLEIGINSVINRIYVTDEIGDKVIVIDGETNDIVDTVRVDGDIRHISVNFVTNLVYVNSNQRIVDPITGGASSLEDIIVIDGIENEIVKIISLDISGGRVDGISVNSLTNRIYLLSGGRVTEIDGGTNEVIDTIIVESGERIDINPVTNRIYVLSIIPLLLNEFGFIRVIDGNRNTVSDRILAGFGFSHDFGINSATNLIYVPFEATIFGAVDTGMNAISVIDGEKGRLVDVIRFDFVNGQMFVPRFIGINSTTNHIYVTSNDINGGTLLRLIDGSRNKIRGSVNAGIGEAIDIAINPVTNRIYVISQDTGNMAVIQDE